MSPLRRHGALARLTTGELKNASQTIAVVGAGWAGCAAAVELTLRGHRVHLFEAARHPGGRARVVRPSGVDESTDAVAAAVSGPHHDAWIDHLDNGQHILLGAYTESLRMMRAVGVDLKASLLRLPLQMRYPDGSGGMDFISPRLPAPLHLVVPLLRAKGLTRQDKLALARFTSAARWIDWRLNADCSVTQLLTQFDQTARVTTLLWRPLCLAALNTAPDQASAQVFLNVLRDSLGARRAASDMLLPRVDMSALFPHPAVGFILRRGGIVHYGMRVIGLSAAGDAWRLQVPATDLPAFDAVILATPASETARLLAAWPASGDPARFTHEPIITCYLQYDRSVALDRPFLALIDDAARQRWGQFVFDRGQLCDSQRGLLSVVVSAASAALAIAAPELARDIALQLAADFNDAALAAPLRFKVVAEKRATFSCTPGLQRPAPATGISGLLRAGDYVAGPYPATLEAAVRSGVAAARMIDRG